MPIYTNDHLHEWLLSRIPVSRKKLHERLFSRTPIFTNAYFHECPFSRIFSYCHIHVNEGSFQLLKADAPGILVDFLKYFEETYVGISARDRRLAVAPRYPIAWWNQYNAVLEGKDTTNNVSEGWHNRFRKLVNKDHPDLYSALKEFQKEQADTEIAILELRRGKSTTDAPKKKWYELKERCRIMVSQY